MVHRISLTLPSRSRDHQYTVADYMDDVAFCTEVREWIVERRHEGYTIAQSTDHFHLANIDWKSDWWKLHYLVVDPGIAMLFKLTFG